MGGMMGGGGKGQDTSGGISPEQQALAQYTFGQNVLGNNTQFAGEGNVGMGPSTGLTQAVGGSRSKEAFDMAQMSDADAKAMDAFNQQQSSALESIAGQAGSALGSLGGGGGGGGFG